MSVTTWNNPNDPNPDDPIDYKIGTEGRELFPIAEGSDVFDTFLNAVRSIYNNVTGLADIIVPTYGLWAGPGWAGGQRLSGDENGDIKWSRPPCYNENIRKIAENPDLDPESCLSIVDAITKTHDWMYTQAENKKASGGYTDSEYKNALLTADVYMLHNIAEALKNNCTYTSETGIYLGNGQWEAKTYTNTFGLDAAEKNYLEKLVPLFLLKIKIQDDSESKTWLSQAITDAQTIKTYVPFMFSSVVDPIDPSIVSTIEEKNGIIIIQQEKALSSDAWIMDMNSTKDPAHITITYDANSSKSADIFVINDDGSISINCGLESEITFSGAKNNGSAGYTFEVTGGDGYNKYNLDSSFTYELIDNGNNDINITSLNDEGLSVDNVGSLYKEEGSWESTDGSIVLNDQMITLANGNTIDLGANFEDGDYGINLIDDAVDFSTPNPPITGDLAPIDFDPDTEGIQTQTNEWGNIITDPNQSETGRADDLNDTTGNDSITGGAGDDNIHTIRGGSDRIQGGDGNDIISVNTLYTGPRETLLNSIIEGGAGSDIILGHYSVSNQLFGDTYGDMSVLIAAGETAPDSGLKGDFISDYYLYEWGQSSSSGYIYGSDGKDILINNTGMGVIVGGGGDDLIYGDFDGIISANSNNTWGYTIDVTTDENGNKQYTSNITGIDITNNTVVGAGKDDVIYAGTGNDFVNAGGGDDEVYGGTGNDTIFGEAGYDFIEGGNGDDILIGDNGNLLSASLSGGDYIDGGAGNDSIWGDAGNDELFGGADNDIIYGGEGNDYLDGEAGANTLYGGAGNDVIFGETGNDYIVGDNGDDYIDAGDGDNTIWGGADNDEIWAGSGNDWIQGDAGNDYLDGGAGNNNLLGGEGDDELFGGHDIDLLQGDAGNDYLEGFEGNDIMLGLDGNDTLFGDEGDDKVQGDAGDDYLDGGTGNDSMLGMDGADTVFGGEDNDSVWGGAGNDKIYGEAGNDQLAGEAGDDYLDGGTGNDYLIGGSDNDTLTGGSGSDYILGGAGNDTYVFAKGDGSDIIVNYTDDYASITDTVQFGTGIAVEDLVLAKNGNDLQIKIDGTTDSLTIKNWFSGDGYKTDFIYSDATVMTAAQMDELYASTITYTYGTDGNDSLYGGSSNDSIEGGSGNDTLAGGTGSDTLAGGEGDDTYLFNSGDGITTIVDTSGSNTLLFGEGITLDDLRLALGSMVIRIGDSEDVVRIDNFDPNSVYDPNAIRYYAFSDGSVLYYTDIIDLGFDINGTPENDQIHGTNTSNHIMGLGGNDYIVAGLNYNGKSNYIDGGAGADTMIGGTWHDTYIVDNVGDVVTENAYNGTDIIYSSVTYTLPANVENLTLTGSDAINGTGNTLENIIIGNDTDNILDGGANYDTLKGGAGNDTLYGGAGKDTLDGEGGADAMYGGVDDDTYVIDNVKDVVFENVGEGTDMVQSNFTYTLGTNVENLTLTGNSVIDGTGNSLNNVLTGNSANNILSSGAGNDTLYGGDGDDYIDGGTGADRMTGGAGNDTYVIDYKYDNVSESPNQGIDTVLSSITISGLSNNVENLILSDSDAIDGSGNESDNVLTGNAGNNTLSGMEGSDTYNFGRGSGVDTIINCVSYYSGNNCRSDYISAIDTIAFGEGITIADLELVKENSNLRINIKGTTDSLIVKDWFYFDAFKVDLISFTDGTILNASQLEAIGYQVSDTINQINGTTNNDTIIGTAGNDQIFGSAGNDTISAGSGYDTLDGGTGNDILEGGAGNDTYMFGYGSGKDLIKDYASDNITSFDILVFGEGITPADLALFKEGNNLRIELLGGEDSIVIQNWMGSPSPYDGYSSKYNYPYQIDWFVFADGTVMTGDYIDYNPWLIDQLFLDELASMGGNVYGSGSSERLSFFGARAGDTQINGYSGDDYLYGGDGDDIIDGGEGDDTLSGGDGNDTYKYGIGSGIDTIYYYDVVHYISSSDIVEFGEGITVSDLELARDYDDLIININGSYDTLKINFYYGQEQIDQFRFVDGTVLTWAQMVALGWEMNGSPGNDTLYLHDGTMATFGGQIFGYDGDDVIGGSYQSDTLDGGSGNDTIYGHRGGDTYIFGIGSGNDAIYPDQIINYDVKETVAFGAGITSDNLELIKRNNDLIINVTGTYDSLTIKDWFNGYAGVYQFKFFDNTIMSANQIEELGYVIADADINYYGWDANEQINGAGGNDTLYGYAGNDILEGGAGNDLLYAGDNDDTLDGGTGNDTLYGEMGNDTYKFGIGSCVVRINNSASDYTSTTDIVEFGQGITSDNIILLKEGYDLIISINGTSDSLIIQDWFYDNVYKVDQFVFADGTVLTAAQIEAQGLKVYGSGTGSSFNDLMLGFAGDDTLAGNAGDDILDGGAGHDTLTGGEGNDIYKFGRGLGVDGVQNYSSDYATTIDTVEFGEGITTNDLELVIEWSNLRINIQGSSDSLIINNWFGTDAYKVDQFKFADGTVLTASQLESMGCLVYGSTGNDTNINGSIGNDKMYGFTGDDTYNLVEAVG